MSTPIPAVTGASDSSSAAPTGVREVERSLVRSIAWTSSAKWASQALTWAMTLAVARILGKTTFGLVAMAGVFMGLVALLSEFGIGSAVVNLRDLDRRQIAELNTMAVLFGTAASVIAALGAPLVGAVNRSPQSTLIIYGLAPTMLLGTLQTVPNSLLQREMRFKLLAIVDGVQGISTSLATILFAMLHFDFWSIVIGQLIGVVLRGTILLIARPHSFAWPSGRASHAIRFSWDVVISRVAWYTYSNADFEVVAYFLGSAAVGAYTVGWEFANIPIEKITSLVGRVTPSFFAAAKNDLPQLRRHLLSVTEAIAIVTFPATIGLALVARSFVLITLGPSWTAAIVPLQLLSVSTGLRSISPLLQQVLVARGETRYQARWTVVAAVVLPFAFWFGTHWGTAGVAAAWVVAQPIVILPPLCIRVFSEIDLSLRAYLRSLLAALVSAGAMCVGVIAVDLVLPGTTPLPVRLFGLAALGGAIYVGMLATVFRQRSLVMIKVIKSLRG